ncbi:hypothetical protein [Streptomyces sp. NPDC058612]|uniref:hypothetical protein n=1 Tax=Streptomyces sp. NPDC058612 TaxID=3346555 RepID=UPI00365354C3
MSMPPPQSPGPYGPAQPPTPYGGSHHPAHPAPPAQAPYPAQGYPQQPYAQPFPAQGGWGQPPMGPPPRRKRTGLVVGIVAASLVGLGVIGFAVKLLGDAGQVASGAGFPDAQYRLTVPPTVLNGTYTLAQDLSETEGKKALAGAYDPKIRDPKPAVGQYTSGPATGMSALVFSGMYGQFKDPAAARRKMMGGAADAQGATVAVPARDITPPGSGITVTCQVLTSTQGGATSTLPMCAWADENTGASVAVVTPETVRRSPGSVDLQKVAATTLEVREETRKPIG